MRFINRGHLQPINAHPYPGCVMAKSTRGARPFVTLYPLRGG